MFGAVVCKPRPVSNETRSRASYITLADASIDRAFSLPRKIALLSSDCADTAWIRLKWNQGEERPSDFSLLQFEAESRPSFVPFRSSSL